MEIPYNGDEIPHTGEQPGLEFDYVVGALELDVRLPVCHSLKEKRGIMARLMNYIRKHYPVSVAEVGHQNDWNRAGLVVTAVSGNAAVVNRTLRAVADWIEDGGEVELVYFAIQTF